MLQIGFEQYIEKYHIDIILNSYYTKIHKVVPLQADIIHGIQNKLMVVKIHPDI